MMSPASAGGSHGVTVTVPASSANLGCAFDCAALALNLYLHASAKPGAKAGFEVRFRGRDAERVPADETNLVVQAIRRLASWAGNEIRGCQIEIESQIPVGVGLGSSAAAIVAGLLLGTRLAGAEPGPADLLSLGVELEGHPDNLAAALHGGLVFAAASEDGGAILTWKTSLPPDLKLVAVVPAVALPTEKARAVLPKQYSRADVVHNLQRVALLAAACSSGRGEFNPEMFRDRLHQPYRSPLVPGLEACLQVRHPGLLGVFLSGAGSSVLALARHSAQEIGDLMAGEFRRAGVEGQILFLKAENRGAQVSPLS